MFPKRGEWFAPHLSLLVKDKCPKFGVFQVEVALFRNALTPENGQQKCQDYVEKVGFKNRILKLIINKF